MNTRHNFFLVTALFSIALGQAQTLKVTTAATPTTSTQGASTSLYVGTGAGNSATNSGNESTFVGFNSGYSNVGGYFNSFFGHNSGKLNTTGHNNAFAGNGTGEKNTTGYFNTFLGSKAGYNNKDGYKNTFIGSQSGYNNIGSNSTNQGHENTFIGYQSGYKNATGHDNMFLGNLSGYHNTDGNENTFIGSRAGQTNKASGSTFIGFRSGYLNNGGANNTAIGINALSTNQSGQNNVAIGKDAGKNILGNYNTIIGSNILGTSTMNNHVIIGDGEGNERIFIKENGYTGIGDYSGIDNNVPWHKLEISTNVSDQYASIGVYNRLGQGRLLLAHAGADFEWCDQSKKGDAVIGVGKKTVNTPSVQSTNLILANESEGEIKFVTSNLADFWQSKVRLKINKSGKVLIGPNVGDAIAPTSAGTNVDVSNYSLFVDGGILTEEVRVSLKSNWQWADYVFEKDYDLKSLNEVEDYIHTNGHLPNVPSAAQVAEEGIELGEMTKIQQEKIEELTLYLIQQQKEIEALKVMVKALSQKQ